MFIFRFLAKCFLRDKIEKMRIKTVWLKILKLELISHFVSNVLLFILSFFIVLLSLLLDVLSSFFALYMFYALRSEKRGSECDKGNFHVGIEQHGTEYTSIRIFFCCGIKLE